MSSIIAAGVFLLLLGLGRRGRVLFDTTVPPDMAAFQKWVWPLPIMNGRKPKISDGYASRRWRNGSNTMHGGVDLMYDRISSDPPLPQGKKVYKQGSRGHYIPDNTPVLAAASGKIWNVKHGKRGWSVVIDHGNYATFYTHLRSMFQDFSKGDEVALGQRLGLVGGDPSQGENAVWHLHFEIWDGPPTNKINPETVLPSMQMLHGRSDYYA